MLFFENIKLAFTAIRANKMRSFLTMLGIIIGISSVISITSIGASAQAVINKEFESFGAAYMAIMVNWQTSEVRMESDLFNYSDVEALKRRFPDDAKYAELPASTLASTKVGRLTADLSIIGVGADYNKFYKGIKILHGRMINKSDVDVAKENVVVDVKLARNLFNKENVVGKMITANMGWGEKDLTIVGVFDTPPSLFSAMMMSNRYDCYVPISMLIERDTPSWYIEIYGNENKDPLTQAKAFLDYLTKIKGKEEGFYTSETADSQIAQINVVLGTLSVALGAIAAISLLVGGIGIMNIMLVSVTERTREIGIRKSLGARTRDILTQFLIEAMILSSIGGIIGTILGISTAGAGMSLFNMQVIIQPMVIVFTVIFSAAVGMFFGIFPARKAARLDPIEALRYE